MSNEQTIADLGEIEALRRTVGRLNPGDFTLVGSGDDAAVVATTDNSFVVTTDTMIEDHDFRLDWSTFFALGYKAVATNLSDVAAMGAKPTALVVSLAVPKSTRIASLEEFAYGLRAACEQLSPGVAVVGGDLASSEKVFISVTAHGQLEGRAPVLRSGAKAGDLVAVAGLLGHAAAGLDILRTDREDRIMAYDSFVEKQLQPKPPIASGVSAALAGATSMIDISDALSLDAARVAKASEVAIHLSRKDLDGFCAMVEEPALALGAVAIDWVLHGGEDHSLLATFPADAKLPREFKVIGKVTEGSGVFLDGEPIPANGWDSVVG